MYAHPVQKSANRRDESRSSKGGFFRNHGLGHVANSQYKPAIPFPQSSGSTLSLKPMLGAMEGPLERVQRKEKAPPDWSQVSSVMGNGKPLQRYSTVTRQDMPFRMADDGQIGVSLGKGYRQCLYATSKAGLAPNVLKVAKVYENNDKAYSINVPYVKDCGQYARRIIETILGVKGDEVVKGQAVNIQGGPKEASALGFTSLYKETLSGQANPDIGDAFMALNNPQDLEYGKGHFNFHWGAVVAKSGNDVITAEADSNASGMWFQLYSVSKIQQSFHSEYVGLDKLDKSAKVFRVTYQKQKKMQPKDIEVIDLSDSD